MHKYRQFMTRYVYAQKGCVIAINIAKLYPYKVNYSKSCQVIVKPSSMRIGNYVVWKQILFTHTLNYLKLLTIITIITIENYQLL